MLKHFIVGLVCLFYSSVTIANIGQVKNMTGKAQIVNLDGTERTVQVGDVVSQSDVIHTGENSSIGITFIDNSRISAGSNTILTLKKFNFNDRTHEGSFITHVKQGTLAIISGKIAKQDKEAMKVELKSSILGVRGTYFLVKVSK